MRKNSNFKLVLTEIGMKFIILDIVIVSFSCYYKKIN